MRETWELNSVSHSGAAPLTLQKESDAQRRSSARFDHMSETIAVAKVSPHLVCINKPEHLVADQITRLTIATRQLSLSG